MTRYHLEWVCLWLINSFWKVLHFVITPLPSKLFCHTSYQNWQLQNFFLILPRYRLKTCSASQLSFLFVLFVFVSCDLNGKIPISLKKNTGSKALLHHSYNNMTNWEIALMLYQIAAAKSETRMETTATIFSFIKRGDFVSVEKCIECDVAQCNVAAVAHFCPTQYTLQCTTEFALCCVYLFSVCIVCFPAFFMSFFPRMPPGLHYLSDWTLLRPRATIESFTYYYGSCCCRFFRRALTFISISTVKIEPLIF